MAPSNGRLVDHGARVDEGPDGDEEQRDEGVAQGEQARQRLVSVVRLADEQPGQEGTQREREPRRLGERGRPQPDGQGHQEEQLFVVRAGHPRQERRDHLEGQVAEGQQNGRALGEPPAQRRGAARRRRCRARG